ncbi:MAG: L-tyrosine/L-tryptophan isonitrile synthase family protein [Candidatus Paceibacterota bacterium]|jgi:pyoverdine/dityrosine biosynthesis protein Dit1
MFSRHIPESALTDAVLCLEMRVPCACDKPTTRVSAILDEIVGTKQTRKGPRPDQASLAAIREVIERYVSLNLPIPFMSPWGSEKPDGSTIDIAELCALKTIQCLHERVQRHYAPGVICHIRVEDVSAPHLFYDRADEARKEAQLYSDAFESLVQVLGCECIRVRRESARTSEARFNQVADEILPFMERHLSDLNSLNALDELRAIGWKTAVTEDMVGEYLNRYVLLYPQKSFAERRHILARYLSGVLARNKLSLRGDDPSWQGKFLDLSFVEPSRTSAHSFPRRVYYRTIPTSISSNHVPPWRAKGHLVICRKSSSVRPRVTSFHERLPLNQSLAKIHGNGLSVALRCDWQST